MKKTLILLTAVLTVMALGQRVWACVPTWEHGNPDATNIDCGFFWCGLEKWQWFNIYWHDSANNVTAHRTQFETHGVGQSNPPSGICWPSFYEPTAQDGGETGTGSWTQRVISYEVTFSVPVRCITTEDHYFTEVDNCFLPETGGGDGGGDSGGGGGGGDTCSMEIIPTGYWDDCVRYDDLYGEFCVGGYVYYDEIYEICY